MKITLQRTGGIGNVSLPDKTIETEKENDRLLVDRAMGSIDLILIDPPPDAFHYTILISDGDSEKKIEAHDGNLNEDLHQLIDMVIFG